MQQLNKNLSISIAMLFCNNLMAVESYTDSNDYETIEGSSSSNSLNPQVKSFIDE